MSAHDQDQNLSRHQTAHDQEPAMRAFAEWVASSGGGKTGIGLSDAFVAAWEAQQTEIDSLKAKAKRVKFTYTKLMSPGGGMGAPIRDIYKAVNYKSKALFDDFAEAMDAMEVAPSEVSPEVER